MTVDEASTAAVEPSAPDLIRQTQWDLNHLTGIRKRVFGQREQYERLRAFIHEQAEGTLQAGLAWFVLGKYADALEILNSHREEQGVAMLRSLCLTQLGRFDEAVEVVAEPKTPDEARARAVALLRAKDRRALEALLREPGFLENTAWIPFLRGWFAEESLQIDEALRCYRQAYEIEPSLEDCAFRYARLLDLKGHDDEAIEVYERMLSQGPADLAVLTHLGLIFEDREEFGRAEQCFLAAQKLDPSNPRLKMYLTDVRSARNMVFDEDMERREGRRNQILRTPITDFELSVRSRNCLDKMGIRTLGDLVTKTEAELLSYKNFGETSLEEIQEILRAKGLRLGIDPNSIGAGSPFGDEGELDPNDPRNRPISELEVSIRAKRIIEMFKLRTIGDLVQKTEAELMACPNFGQTSLNEIKTKLDELGLSLRS